MSTHTGRSIVIQLLVLWSGSLLRTSRVVLADGSGEIIQKEVVYRLGQELKLNCTPDGGGDYDGYGYAWLKNKSVLEQRIELRDSSAVLYVTNATEDEFGEYECNITAPSGKVAGTISWHVTAQPELTLPPHVNLTERDTLKLQCVVRGKPHERVGWTHEAKAPRDGAQLRTSCAGVPCFELVLANVTRSDAGLYSCRIKDVTANTTVYVAADQHEGRHAPDRGLTSVAPAVSAAPGATARVPLARAPLVGDGVRPTRGGVLAVAGSLCLASCLALYLHCRFNAPYY